MNHLATMHSINRQTDRQTDTLIMPIAGHAACSNNTREGVGLNNASDYRTNKRYRIHNPNSSPLTR